MESAVACRAAPDQGRDVFTNVAPLYRPLWGRGAFGGAVLAQALAAAQATVPLDFVVDTMHCHFFIAVKSDGAPLYSHVERLRDGRSIATRSVRAMQHGKCVFSAMLNFGRAAGRGPRMLEHQPASPVSAAIMASIRNRGASSHSPTSQVDATCPFESIRVPTPVDDGHKRPELQRIIQMTRGKLPTTQQQQQQQQQQQGGGSWDRATNLAALAYMTDNFFLGTVTRVHKAYRFANENFVSNVVKGLEESKRASATERFGILAKEEVADAASRQPAGKRDPTKGPSNVDMMVSLDHTIFFHNQDALKSDDWLVMEMETPWAGQDRALVLERIWTSEGVLVATCIQEGLMRISQTPDAHL